MCKNATATAAELMAAIEPTFTQLLTLEGLATTPDGIAAINAFNAAQAALAVWKPGTTAQTVVETINAFSSVFATLPIPQSAKDLEAIIVTGIDVVLATVEANSTTVTADQKRIADEALKRAQAKIPGFKVSLKDRIEASLGDHTVAAKEYKSTWNKAVAAAGEKYAPLKVA